MLRVFGIVPGAATAAFAITAVWMLASMVVAVRQALDYESTGRAIAVCVVGWTLAIAIAVTIGLAFGPALS
jgi:predicted MFS family arabinose efflux permease